MSLRPNQRLSQVLSTLDQCLVSYKPVICLPHTRTRLVLFLGFSNNIPNLELFPNRAPMELSRIAFLIKVLPEDDRTDFAQEERLDLTSWTKILATCAPVDVSKYLDILTLEFSTTMVQLPFFLGVSSYCVRCLSCASWYSCCDIPSLLLPSFVTPMILAP